MNIERQAPALRDAIIDVLAARDINAVWRSFSTALVAFGFDKILYCGIRMPGGCLVEDINDALLLHLGPQEYLDQYLGSELYRGSPAYAWASQNSGFASWPDAIAALGPIDTLTHKRILKLNADFGICSGYVGSLKGLVPGMRGIIGMSPARGLHQPEADRLWARHGKDIEILCQLLHLRVASLPQTDPRRPLTSRQREALQWCSQGKTMQDIATIMGVRSVTIEKHLRMAREALNAQTTAHAVQKAMALNLLNNGD
ncbi:autoinducer binding domain-containing protein [Sulfitobacter aestuarii]|uniref:Autoinducer binding domain-containing protein n=1 Tax=Sulfitobacter aestuarii TaxID=2161676 RepID=A0ABW5U3A7_9RHOB